MRSTWRGHIIRQSNVLVAVLKSRRDRDILLREKWYRIPCDAAPKRTFRYLAFYQPACFGREGKRIQYYARVSRIEKHPRRVLLPREQNAPNANAAYRKIFVSGITELPRPVKNTIPRRISFGFTTLARLKKSRNILELYNVAPIEEMMKRAFARAGIPAIPQYSVSRYRLDFAIFCHPTSRHSEPRDFARGKLREESRCSGMSRFARHDVQGAWNDVKYKNIAIECDNTKAHSSPAQRKKDRAKDAFLRRRGWRVMRLKEDAILLALDACLARVRKAQDKEKERFIV